MQPIPPPSGALRSLISKGGMGCWWDAVPIPRLPYKAVQLSDLQHLGGIPTLLYAWSIESKIDFGDKFDVSTKIFALPDPCSLRALGWACFSGAGSAW